MSRRGKDDGFDPHPGDPWHPGWSSDEEPVSPEDEPISSDDDLPRVPEPSSATGVGPEGPAPSVGEEGAPVESAPPPAAPSEGGPAEPDRAEPTLFDAVSGDLGPPPASPDPADVPAISEEGAGERPAEDTGPASPVPGGGAAAEGDVEVEEWLAFAAGLPGAGAGEEAADARSEGEERVGEVAVPAGEAGGLPAGGAERPRRWPFGRRRRGAAEPEGVPGEAEGPLAGEQPEDALPPPWSPETEWEESRAADVPVVPGPLSGETPAGEAQGVGEPPGEEGAGEPVPPPWMPQADLDRAAAVPVVPGPPSGGGPADESGGSSWGAEEERIEAGEPGEPASVVEAVPTERPGIGQPGQGAGPERSEEGEAAAPPSPPPLVPPPEAARDRATGGSGPIDEDEEEEEAWAEFAGWETPVAGRPSAGATQGPPPAGPETAGVPTMEVPAPDLFDFARPESSTGLRREEILAGGATAEHRHLAEEVAAADTAEAQLQALSAPMPGLESGVVGFEDVVQPGGEEEPAASARSDLPIRVVTGLALVGILLGSLWVGGELLAGLVGLLALLALAEFYGTLRRRGYAPLTGFGFLGAVGLLVGTWFLGLVAIPVAVIGVTVVSFFYYSLASRRREPLTNGSLTLLGVLWIPGTLAFAFPIAAAPGFRVLVLAVAATVIATDVGAFFAGRSWGSRPLAPTLSPHKTVEGLAGGVVLGVAAAVVLGYFLEPLDLRAGAALGLIVAVMAPLGDLAESMLKRSLGVKDMGSILPGHGGVLDRVDAFLFVLPAAWVLYEALGLLR